MENSQLKSYIENLEETFDFIELRFDEYRRESQKFVEEQNGELQEQERKIANLMAQNSAMETRLSLLQSSIFHRIKVLVCNITSNIAFGIFPQMTFRHRALGALNKLGFDIQTLPFKFIFDSEFYLLNFENGEVTSDDALKHYLSIGEANGLCPNRYFDPIYYEKTNSQYLKGKSNRLLHFLESGLSCGLVPSKIMEDYVYLAYKENVEPHFYLARKFQ